MTCHSTQLKLILLEVTHYNGKKFYCRKRKICSKRLSIATTEVEGLGGYLRDQEERSRRYFDGTERLEGNNYGKWARPRD
jgi:hypothetical protein